MNWKWGMVLLIVCALNAGTGRAQFQQYSTSGGANFQSVPDQDAFDQAMEDALWRTGRWFVDPWLGITGIGYTDGFALTTSDSGRRNSTGLQASAGAGLRIYRPIGSRATWAIHALPEYSWFEAGDRSRVNGRYGTGIFANLGGVLLQLSARRADQLRYFSREVEDQISLRQDYLEAAAELALFGALSLRLEGGIRTYESLEDDSFLQSLGQLDREESRLTAGFRLRSNDGWTFGFGAGVVETELDMEALLLGPDRSSDGTLVYAEFSQPTELFDVNAYLQLLQVDFTESLGSLELDELVGRLSLRRQVARRFALDVFARRNAALSISQGAAFSVDEAIGIGIGTPLGSVGSLRLFGEIGQNDFQNFLAGAEDRNDEFIAYGASISVRHRSGVGLYLNGRITDYDSNLSQFDRELTTVQGGLSIGLSLGRDLQIGSNSSPWV